MDFKVYKYGNNCTVSTFYKLLLAYSMEQSPS